MDLPAADSLLAQPTRAKLFAALERLRRPASSEELARELGLHVNGVRRQLETLERGGLLERRRVSHGRGRPRDEWAIAADASPAGRRPEAYLDLAGWLARAIPGTPGRLRHIERVGREIGWELAPRTDASPADALRDAFASLGFQPEIGESKPAGVTCRLRNCPYRRSVRENPKVICALHKGMTIGLLETLEGDARLISFEPADPDVAGCTLEVAGAR